MGRMKNWYLIVDVERCENCCNCFLACKDEHVDNEWNEVSKPMQRKGRAFVEILSRERGRFPFVDVAYLPLLCMHCDDPPCMKVAKDNAVYKRKDGIVIFDPEKSKNQKEILYACPYNVVVWNEEFQIPQKCTFCAHLLDQGWKKTRCVQACPTGALSLLELTEEEMEREIIEASLEPYQKGTKVHVYYKNLYLFKKDFIGGSLAEHIEGKEECLSGVRVILYDRNEKRIDEAVTDIFGDFKFDNLDKGEYWLYMKKDGYEEKRLHVTLEKSLFLGVIYLIREDR